MAFPPHTPVAESHVPPAAAQPPPNAQCHRVDPAPAAAQVTHRLNTLRVELYNSYSDDVRFGLEIVLSGWICILLLTNFWEIGMTQVRCCGARDRV